MPENFEKWFNEDCFKEKDEYQNQVEAGVFIEVRVVKEAWQEATKQRDAQYELMAEHTALSIREDAIVGERGRTMRVLINILLAHEGTTLTKGVIATLINIIEKESE